MFKSDGVLITKICIGAWGIYANFVLTLTSEDCFLNGLVPAQFWPKKVKAIEFRIERIGRTPLVHGRVYLNLQTLRMISIRLYDIVLNFFN